MSTKSLNISTQLLDIIPKLKNQRILVIGDLMWDEYILGSCDRISPEAPVPVVLSEEENRTLGGAANVVKNLVSLNISVGIIGVVGVDTKGKEMCSTFNDMNLSLNEIISCDDRPTISKTRIFARNQQILRLDREIVKPISIETEDRIIHILKNKIKNFDAIILSDYDKGLLTPTLITKIIQIAKQNNTYIAVDPQVSHFHFYKDVDVVTPNEKEASGFVKLPFPTNNQDIEDIGKIIYDTLNLKHLLLTRSQKGMALFTKNSNPIYIPTVAKEIYDVTGAGDTVISIFVAAIMAKSSTLEAAILSNIAAGIVVSKLGTATVTEEELKQAILLTNFNL